MTYPTRTTDNPRRSRRRAAHWALRYQYLSLALVVALYPAALIVWAVYPPAGPVLMFGVVPAITTPVLVASFVVNQRRIDQLSTELRREESA